jgi:DNA-binding MarR family transcriptional regulator
MPESSAPLTTAMFHVLLALADGDKHGYAILKDVQLNTGTLYAVIKRLLGEGLIVEVRPPAAMADEDQRRRYYHLTETGRAAAKAEAVRMEKLVLRARSSRLLRAVRPA